jgi:hypothetical protein
MIGSWQCLDPNGDFGGAHCGNRGRDKQCNACAMIVELREKNACLLSQPTTHQQHVESMHPLPMRNAAYWHSRSPY